MLIVVALPHGAPILYVFFCFFFLIFYILSLNKNGQLPRFMFADK